MAKLQVQESGGAREFELVDVEVSIGRELDNALRLPDPSISRHHAVIRQAGAGHEIQDLGSSNGVLINGSRLETAQLLDGDRITLGQLQLTYVNPRTAPKDSPMGTVRLNLEDMAKLQAGTTAELNAPSQAQLAQVAPPPPPAPPAPPAPSSAEAPAAALATGQLPQMPPRRPAPARQAPIPPEAAKPSGAGGLFQWFGSLFRRS